MKCHQQHSFVSVGCWVQPQHNSDSFVVPVLTLCAAVRAEVSLLSALCDLCTFLKSDVLHILEQFTVNRPVSAQVGTIIDY